jgi:hypothetical protein
VISAKTFAILLGTATLCAWPAKSQPLTSNCTVPAAKIALAPTNKADKGQAMILTSFFSRPGIKGCIAATDLQGTPQWSYCQANNLFMTRWVPGGTILTITNSSFTDYEVNEINPAGKIVHSYAQATANSQLAAASQQSIIDFNHEAMRLPNGYTAIIAHNERLETNEQGSGTVDVMGDEVLVIDTNWNLVWSWNAFDWLPVNRAAPLGETCHPCSSTQTGTCCPITLAAQANDWLHGNSLAYDSSDGNLIMSLRNQDWVIKIAYENGTGDGHVIWTLGNESNLGAGNSFAMLNTPNIPSPWFSHQHDVEVQSTAVPKLLQLFDNGNTRRSTDPTADSRGQVLSIDETNWTADIHMDVNFNFYASGYGTAQLLDNGNYWWQAGAAGGQSTADPTHSIEYVYVPSTYSGTAAYSIQFADTAYRSFRLTSLTGSSF